MRRFAPRPAGCFMTALATVLALLVCDCGDGGTTNPDGPGAGPLVFTRADSTEVVFPSAAQVYVWCGDWSPDEVPVPALHVLVGTPSPGQAYWWLRAVISDLALETPMAFPNYFIWDQPDSVSIFLYDPPNELATDTEESSGTIVFHRIPCPTGDTVDFTIEAVLGSEFGDMPAVAASGRFTEQVTGAPPGYEELLAATRGAGAAGR